MKFTPAGAWLALFLAGVAAAAQEPDPPGAIEPAPTPQERREPPAPSEDERVRLLAVLTKERATLAERVGAAGRLLTLELAPEHLEEMVRAFPERDRRELVSLLERALRSPSATTAEWTNAARLAELAPEPALEAPLLDRLELLLAEPERVKPLLRAVRAAHAAARRRTTELEVERLAQASAEVCVGQIDHATSDVRRAALARLLDLAKRRDGPEEPAFTRARSRVLERLSAAAPGTPARVEIPADELRPVALLAAELAPHDEETERLWLAWLAVAPDVETRLALLAALRRLVRDEPDAEVAAAAASLLAPGREPSPQVAAALEALRFVGDVPSLDALLPWVSSEGATHAEAREKALAAVAEIARRSGDPTFERRALDLLTRALEQDPSGGVRVGAALGISIVVAAIADRSREAERAANGAVNGAANGVANGAANGALDAENLGRAFDALRLVLGEGVRDRTLAEECTKALCRVPGREPAAAKVLADAILAGKPPPPVREVLLRGLRDLAEPAGLPAIVAALPKGGPSVEPDAIGKEAYAALRTLTQKAEAPRVRVAVQLDVVAACLAAGAPEWALQFATQLLDRIGEPDHEERQLEIRLAYGRTAVRSRDAATLERGWTALSAAADEPAAEPAQRREARLLLLEIAERTRPLHAAEAAARAEELLADGSFKGDERADVVQRCATLWLVAGEWGRAYALLDHELEEPSAPPELLMLKARAAARRQDAQAGGDALRLYELLLGARGSGGCIASDCDDRPALTLELARLYVDGARLDDARATLSTLPAAESLPIELREELEQIKRATAGA